MLEIQQAGPMNFIRTLLIIALVYYTLKFLARLFAPFLMKKAVQKMQERAEKQYGGAKKNNDVKVGETIIDKKPNQSKESDKSVGEYIDFEEID
ncbi:DUF4834 family protein [Tenacibaculum sp. SZ-18]|uniref:DUF4834 family protein n=1 Tax=Tenacibaculum sp. SZ-18 TaxID=754423 RepID=UPI001E4B2C3B|nr:DUF4834 family protein [Tenacibaculum sp. SZ-18]